MNFKLLSKAALALAAMGLCLSAASHIKPNINSALFPAPPPAEVRLPLSLLTASDRSPTAVSTSNRISALS